ncbi:MAG: hypothetical protein BRC29_05395 [Nanohaloarchaea archaeon SW_7_43_1]|nr:MAG: hypothetical protein BRC29_05395 [Nanohaloarchaea archaeon SW_7_43_1]
MDFTRRKIAALLLLLLIPGYVLAVFSLPANLPSGCNLEGGEQPGINDQVGVCTDVSATVLRQYYFGTIRLPVHTLSLNIDLINKLFMPFLLVGSIVLWREYI